MASTKSISNPPAFAIKSACSPPSSVMALLPKAPLPKTILVGSSNSAPGKIESSEASNNGLVILPQVPVTQSAEKEETTTTKRVAKKRSAATATAATATPKIEYVFTQAPSSHQPVTVSSPSVVIVNNSVQPATAAAKPVRVQKINCKAEVVTTSMRNLRLKGSSFLRSHASRHGITNASRKLTSQVIQELTEHYSEVHAVTLTMEEGIAVGKITGMSKKTSATSTASAGSVVSSNGVLTFESVPEAIANIRKPLPQLNATGNGSSGGKVEVLQILPQHPVPQSQFVGQNQPIIVQTNTSASAVSVVPASISQMQAPIKLGPKVRIIKPSGQSFTTILLPINDESVPQQATVVATAPPQVMVSKQQAKPLPMTMSRVVTTMTTAATAPSSSLLVTPVKKPSTSKKGSICTSSILSHLRMELAACGTSILRPHAAAHKVHNASRKPKDQVVEELWQHYRSCHALELAAGAAKLVTTATTANSTATVTQGGRTTIAQVAEAAAAAAEGWVGSVQDDEDDGKN